MDMFKKISKTFITFLLTLMLIFQSVITSFVGATTSFAGKEQNLATITIESTKNGTLLFEKTNSKSITDKKGSNIKVLVKPKFGYEAKSIKLETKDNKILDLPVQEGIANVPIINDAKISATFTNSNNQPVQIKEEITNEISNSNIEIEKKENKKADEEDKRDAKSKDNIKDSKIIAEILLKADRTKVGQGTSVIAKDIVTVANTVIDMRKTKSRNLDELWEDRDGDGISDDWKAVEAQFDGIIPLYEVNEKADYYVAKPNLAKIENSQLLQYIIADSNHSGTILNTVIYEKETGLLYVPKNILYPKDFKDKQDKNKNDVRLGRVRIQFLLGINNDIDKTKTDVDVTIEKNKSVKGDIVSRGKAKINTMSSDTKIIIAKDTESRNSIKANSIDEIRVNGHEIKLNDVTYYEKEGVLEIPLKPTQADSIEIKMSNSFVKNISNTIGSLMAFVKPLVSFAGNPSKKIEKVIYFSSTPRKGDYWHLSGASNTRNVNDYGARFPEPSYETTYATNTYSDSEYRTTQTVKMILQNQLSKADADRISKEMGNEKGTQYYTRNSYVNTQRATGSGNADMIIKQGFGLSLNCAHAGVNDKLVWDPTFHAAGVRKDNHGIMVRLLDTDGKSWALFAAVSPSQSTQAGYGFFGANIEIIPPTEKTYGFSIEKTDKSNGENLSGATFKVEPISVSGTNPGIISKTTGYDGKVSFTGLPSGTYRISEVSAPSGYSRITDTKTITLPGDANKTYNFQNVPDIPEGGTVKLKKTDATTGLPIKGAKFELNIKYSDGSVYYIPVYGYSGNYKEDHSSLRFREMETDANGEIEVKVDKSGSEYKYYFTETTPAPGYQLPTNNKTNEDWIIHGGTERFEMTNRKTPKDGTVKLKKTDAATGLPIKGAKFKLRQIMSDKVVTVPVIGYTGNYEENYSSTKFYEMETDYNGEIEVKVRDTGISNKYYFEETTPAPGYQKPSNNKTKEDWVIDGGTETYEMTNTKTPEPEDGVIRITKKDMKTGDVLSGVVFELLDSNKQVIKTATTNSRGIAEFTELEIGNYYVREKSTKAGYILKTDLEQARITNTYKTDNLTIYNEKTPDDGVIKITKKDRKTGDVLSGVVFELLDSNKQVIKTATTNSYGIAEFTGLKVGNYYVREKSTKAGYILKTDLEQARITNTYKTENLTIYNEKELYDLSITKVDSKTGQAIVGSDKVKNAEFRLKDPDGKDVYVTKLSDGVYRKDSSYNYTLKLSNEGKIEILDLDKKGRYTLTEVKAPTGYQLSNTPLICDVVNKYNSFNFKNTQIPRDGSITIVKKDSKNQKTLEGVTFELLNKDKNVIKTLKTNSSGIAKFSNLEYGKYYIREKETIYGYKLNSQLHEVNISGANKSITLSINNEPIEKTIKVIKKDNNGNFLKNAEFTLFKKNGSTLTKVESKVTNDKGEIEFSNLRIGQYVLRETKAPNGFRPYSKDIEIDLTRQVSPVYTVTLNNYKVEENIPSTGTKGATVFLISGLGIIMLAYILKKKRVFA